MTVVGLLVAAGCAVGSAGGATTTHAPAAGGAGSAPSAAASTAASAASATSNSTASAAWPSGRATTAAAAGARPAAAPTARPAATGAPTARPFGGTATVGALFAGAVTGDHACSASVIHSPAHDLIVTAAHCVVGTGAGLQFVPGYVDGTGPYGTWATTAAFADPSWVSDQDPTADVVFLRVADRTVDGHRVGIEDVVGAQTLGTAPGAGERVTVDGYAAGSDDQPLTCTSTVELTGPYPTFGCGGFADGTSGGPWLSAGAGATPSELVGLIGGLHQGGCTDGVSYSSPFTGQTVQLWQRAGTGQDPDTLPAAGSSGCS